MRALLQRVSSARASVDDRLVGSIRGGWVVLLGVGQADDEAAAREMADRIALLRSFSDDQGKMNLSALDVGAEILLVPQFTLYADLSRGRRPSFVGAAPPDKARPLVAALAQRLGEHGLRIEHGEFGAYMLVEIQNEGPVTFVLSSPGDTWGS